MSIQAEKNAEIQEIKEKSTGMEELLEREQSERENEERRRAKLQEEVDNLKRDLMKNENYFMSQKAALEREIKEASQENARLIAIVHNLESELEIAQREFTQAESELSSVTSELANCNVKANELKSLLLTQQHENEVIKRGLESKLSASPTAAVVDPGAGKRQSRIDELKSAVEAANQRQLQLQQEQLDLMRKTEQAQQRLRDKEAELTHAQDAVSKEMTKVEEEPDARKLTIATELKEKIRLLREENEALRRDIEERRIACEETRGRAAEPRRTAACPNCQLF